MKGIVLAGGSATRLRPVTQVVSKQLLPIYDKPMIYYPIATLMQAGIKDILIITTPKDINLFMDLLGDGSRFGINLEYTIQVKPDGLARAFVLGEHFINGDCCALVLGDNLFYGENLPQLLNEARERAENNNETTVFGYPVDNPQSFGIVEIDEKSGKVISIEEKPQKPKTNYAVPGLYFYGTDICQKAKTVKKSVRGEYEISDLNTMYLKENRVFCTILDKEKFQWFDTGSFSDFYKANQYIANIEQNSDKRIAYLEEIALDNKWISDKDVQKDLANRCDKSPYGIYLNNKIKKTQQSRENELNTQEVEQTPKIKSKKKTPKPPEKDNQPNLFDNH